MGASTPQQETVHYISSADFSFILIHWIQQMWPSRETFFFFFKGKFVRGNQKKYTV
jgi:hypothetical protein